MKQEIALTVAQQEAIREIDCNLQIVACAGSGKTEVISRRIARILQTVPDIQPENIVAFTFTNKAAAALKERICRVLGEEGHKAVEKMYVGTIHGFCHALLNTYTEEFASYRILDTVKNHLFVLRYAAQCGMSTLDLPAFMHNAPLFLSCIEKLLYDYDRMDRWERRERDALAQYRNCLYEHKYLDYSHLIFETIRQIRENPSVKAYLKTIRYLVVDEYQDIDDMQEKLIALIAEAGANICVVGDDDQTIYQFRGSNAGNMISFSEHYPNVRQIQLQENFRCAPEIVDVANCVVRQNSERIPKKMEAASNINNAGVRVFEFPNKNAQYQRIAEMICKIHSSGVPYHEIAVLVRKGKYVSSIAAVLQQAGIPYEADSAEHFFSGNYFSRFVRTLETLTELETANAVLSECWAGFADEEAIYAGYKFLRSCARNGRTSLHDALTGFCDKIQFLDAASGDLERRENDLNGILKILDDYNEIYGDYQLTARVTGLLKYLNAYAAEEYRYHSFEPQDDTRDAVRVMTVHKAKGLEFHTVFLPELEQGEFPAANVGGRQFWHILGDSFAQEKGKYQSDLEDERKLFYVALTRAKQNLFLMYETSKKPVSVFVEEAKQSKYLKEGMI